jgi:hypothetical protein
MEEVVFVFKLSNLSDEKEDKTIKKKINKIISDYRDFYDFTTETHEYDNGRFLHLHGYHLDYSVITDLINMFRGVSGYQCTSATLSV